MRSNVCTKIAFCIQKIHFSFFFFLSSSFLRLSSESFLLSAHDCYNAAIWKYWRIFKFFVLPFSFFRGSKWNNMVPRYHPISYGYDSENRQRIFPSLIFIIQRVRSLRKLTDGTRKSLEAILLAWILEAIHRVKFYLFLYSINVFIFNSLPCSCIYLFTVYYLSKNKVHLYHKKKFYFILWIHKGCDFLFCLKRIRNIDISPSWWNL